MRWCYRTLLALNEARTSPVSLPDPDRPDVRFDGVVSAQVMIRTGLPVTARVVRVGLGLVAGALPSGWWRRLVLFVDR